MEPKEEKLTATRLTLSYMERPSKFSYFDGINIKLSEQSRMLDNATIEKMVLLGEVVESDFFILRALAELSWANIEMLVAALQAMHKKEPEKAVPPANRDTVKSRIVRLCKTSLVKGFEYTTASNTPIKVYCVTDAGFNLIRRRLYYSGNSEVFNALNPCEEIFRRLACNYVAQRFSVAQIVSNYIPGTIDFVPGKGKVFLYSRLYVEAEKRLVLFEPVYFKANPLVVSKQNMADYIRDRFAVIKHLDKKTTADGYSLFVIFVVEDYTGLNEALMMIITEMEDWMMRIYFTSENAIYSVEKIGTAVLKISDVSEGRPTLKACTELEFLHS